MELRKLVRGGLKKLKNEYVVISIKSEFEAEFARKDELIMLCELVGLQILVLLSRLAGAKRFMPLTSASC